MATPPRLVELACPTCHATHWQIDHDFRGAALVGGAERGYGERAYSCPRCGRSGAGYKVKQKSPSEFFIQPHDMYPMTAQDFQHWLAVLKEHFPDHPNLKVVGMSWYPGKQRSDHWQRLHPTMALGSSLHVSFSDHAVAAGRLCVVVHKTDATGGEATFWVEPRIELCQHFYGFDPTELAEAAALIGRHEGAIREAWQRYVEDVRAFQRESLALLDKPADARRSFWQRILSFVGRARR